MNISQEQFEQFREHDALVAARNSRMCTRFGLKHGGMWGMLFPMVLSLGIGGMVIIILAASTTFDNQATVVKSTILMTLILTSLAVAGVIPFVFLKSKYALRANLFILALLFTLATITICLQALTHVFYMS